MNRSFAFPISEISHIGEARRRATSIARELGFSAQESGVTALVVTELAQNLVKFAQNGQLVFRRIGNPTAEGLEVLSLDSGPGMTDVPRSLIDGYSTSGTPGTGLGAVRRNSSFFDIYSSPTLGTAIVSRIMRQSRPGVEERREALEVGAVCVPLSGQEVSGDSWIVCQDAHRATIMLVDGLGHGQEANQAAREAVRVVERKWIENVETIASRIHELLRPMRGAVVAVASVNLSDGGVKYLGIGNISASITEWDSITHMVSMNGTAGLNVNMKSFSYSWPKDGILVMNSDGLTGHWKLSSIPGLMAAHPSIIAGVLYQNFCRGKDDVTVVVVRWKQG